MSEAEKLVLNTTGDGGKTAVVAFNENELLVVMQSVFISVENSAERVQLTRKMASAFDKAFVGSAP